MDSLAYTIWHSPIGALTLCESQRGLVSLAFGERPPKGATRNDRAAAECRRQLQEYFAGRRREFTVPLDLQGTDFQLRCWQALLKIPYGETRTYAQQARTVKCPQGFRAVGMANHDNPVAIVVPCHRVVASNGGLGGYGGGLDLKRRLLLLESGQGALV
ncbi:MAG TPA: methylated-DNA--[protein]-cysteine S-methyltransferase [Terriglobales bacterium]|nr:methylated-DNA--[protein]-cysteine S-methyltransferase [Terriglobales bacterium]